MRTVLPKGAKGIRHAAWVAHAASRLFARRVDEARRAAVSAMERGSLWVAVSGGKDSVALLHLVRSIDARVPAWHIDSGAEPPHVPEVLDALAAIGLEVQTCRPEMSILDMLRITGALGHVGETRRPGEWHWSPGAWKQMLIEEPSDRITLAGGHVGHFDGVRADESRGRRTSFASRGATFVDAHGFVTSRPLSGWTGTDSLAYAAAFELPIGQLYLDDIGADAPERRRTGTMLGASAASHGRYADLRARHPQAWRELVRDFPHLAALS